MRFFWNKPKNASNDTFTVTVTVSNKQVTKSDFVAIDFETAQGPRWSVCQVGLVIVENGEIKQSFCHLIQPPDNKYSPVNINIHKITPDKTEHAPHFPEVWKKIKPLIENKLIVAHSIDFDIDCLRQTLNYYEMEVPEYDTDCTFRRSGMKLDEACAAYNIELTNHHDAECDAKACACLYISQLNGVEPDYSRKVTSQRKKPFDFTGHDRIKGDLLKPDLENADSSNPFYGKKVVFTGELEGIGRNQAAICVKDMGADIDTQITKKTNFVVVGEDPGYAKMAKISKYNDEGSNIKIIYEPEFLKMIN